jgi:hypothetical protein
MHPSSGPTRRLAVALGFAVLAGLATPVRAQALRLDEAPARPGEWGYRPADGSASAANPPGFSWRPSGGYSYDLSVARDEAFEDVAYLASGIELNVHCPPRTIPPGRYHWRYRGRTADGRTTDWSRSRAFTVAEDASEMPLPPRAELLARIPGNHPRLFFRPEDLDGLRRRARTDLEPQFEALVAAGRRLLDRPPSVEEPPRYAKGMVRGSDPWREVWWGNRKRVIAALDGAAQLAFVRLLGGPAEFGEEAKRILLACAAWDPKGSTGYHYNDEAGMPFAYHFSRAYTFLHHRLSEEERALCRRVMRVRGGEMYRHLCPRHLWRPYSSHSNRAWHFLGEVGIAFHGEIPEAGDWVWFAVNVFMNAYPVWSDDDGGWHEGANYWSSYQGRFTWWADVMNAALLLDAYRKPYYAKAGYYAMYLMPPGKVGGGFGDLTARTSSQRLVPLMTVLAAQARNPHWQWWVDRCGGPKQVRGYVGFLRGALPAVPAEAPEDLPSSRVFRGIGQAVLNSDLLDAGNCVQITFKSSPMGTQSHGYEANNAFLLFAYGERLLIRSGYRDSYGSAHHRGWMWSPRSVNTVTVNGGSRPSHSATDRGRITSFATTPELDLVVGEAGRHRRAILFVKPDIFLVHDRIRAKEPSSFEYRLHALERFEVREGARVLFRRGEVTGTADFLAPEGLVFTQTDHYDPNPRPRIKLREWHLTAAAPGKTTRAEYLVAYRVARGAEPRPLTIEHRRIDGGRVVSWTRDGLAVTALLPSGDGIPLEAEGLRSEGGILLALREGGRVLRSVAE